jgi:hypothetical protein
LKEFDNLIEKYLKETDSKIVELNWFD